MPADLAPLPPETPAAEAPAAETPPLEAAAPPTCPNCGVTGVGAYCAGCGQRHPSGRLTLRSLWRDFVSRAFSLDRGLWHTLARLAGGPGRVPADYVRGLRQRYTHPLSFYLLTAALYLLGTGLHQEALVQGVGTGATPVFTFDDDVPAEAPANASLSVGQRIGDAANAMNGEDGTGVMRRLLQIQSGVTTPLLIFYALFLVLPLRLLLGPQRNLAETAIFTLYTVGAATLAIAVLAPILFTALPVRVATAAQSVLTLGLYAGIGAWGAVAFWTPGWRTVLKAGGAALLGFVVYTLASGVVALAFLLGDLLEAAGLAWGDLLAA